MSSCTSTTDLICGVTYIVPKVTDIYTTSQHLPTQVGVTLNCNEIKCAPVLKLKAFLEAYHSVGGVPGIPTNWHDRDLEDELRHVWMCALNI